MKSKIIIILGPTGVGKSEVALELAERFGAEIVNADSQQVYRFMDIGTAKPSPQERDRVPHHLIDIVDPDGEFNVAIFRQLAMQALNDIQARGRRAIVCGGTGLYIRALTQGLFVGPGHNTEIRERLETEIREAGLDPQFQRLVSVDPGVASSIHPNDRQRIIRALEVYELSGIPMSEWQREHGFKGSLFDTLKIGLHRDRRELYDRINQRCEGMIQHGLLEEVRGLVARGYGFDLRSLQSVGYHHMELFLSGTMSVDEAVLLMKRDTRRLAKRQLTWFRGDKNVQWFHPEQDTAKISSLVGEFLA
jgi:tRNA dimethylallyltransferase